MHPAVTISLLVFTISSAEGQLRSKARFVITNEQVAAVLHTALAKRGATVRVDQVNLPATVTASEDAPTLAVQSVQELGSLETSDGPRHGSAVKLTCTRPGTCLPFYALVTWPDSDAGQAASKQLRAGPINGITAEPIAVKPGAHVTLMLDSGSAHITMGAISMERGSIGGRIKVRSADGKQFYSAEVVSPDVVKGTF